MKVVLIILIIILFICLITVSVFLFYSKREGLKKSELQCVDVRDLKKANIKHKILIYNSFAYSKMPEYAQYSIEINKRYAEKYGYDYIQINHELDEYPPYWLRVIDAKRLLESDRYDYIVYLDLDACFYNFDYSIEDFLKTAGNYDMYIGQDIGSNVNFNSGCYFIKNSSWSKQFVNIWSSICIDENGNMSRKCKSKWIFDNKKWKCNSCTWAGKYYEQGALNTMISQNILNALDHVVMISKNFGISNFDIHNKSFVLHLMGFWQKHFLTSIFQNILKSLN